MSLDTRIREGFTEAGLAHKALAILVNGNVADLSSLLPTNKSSLVAALNELKTAVDSAAQSGGAVINDTTTVTSSTWSSKKISDSITAAISALTSGAPGALDTLDELAAALGDDANFAATITTALSKRLRFDVAQTLTSAEQLQARANIGAVSATDVGPTDTNYVALFNTARA